MVDPVEQEMEHERPVPVGQVVVDVEEEAVERVLEDSPDHVAEEEACEGLGERRGVRDGQGRKREREQVRGGDGLVGELEDRQGEEERRDGSPDQRHDIPLGTRESLLGNQQKQHNSQGSQGPLASRISHPNSLALSLR